MAVDKVLLVFAAVVILSIDYGTARDCKSCQYIHMRYSGLPKIEGMDLESMLPTSFPGMNDTACYDGTRNDPPMKCENNPCVTRNIQVSLFASQQIGQDQSISYGITMTMVIRSCGQAGTAAGCTSPTLDTTVGPGPGGQPQTLQQYVSQVAQNMNQTITPTISGEICTCDDADMCNNKASTLSLVEEASTTAPPETTTGPTLAGASLRPAICTALLIAFVAMFFK